MNNGLSDSVKKQVRGNECDLPQEISLDSERYLCAEALFQPSLIGLECVGLHETVYESIMLCDTDTRPQLLSHVLLAGRSSLFEGIANRLRKELLALAPSTRTRLCSPPERGLSAWIGGSILASLATFQQMWQSKEEYDESGPGIISCPRK